MTANELILASASPRRAQLLRAAGYDFRVVPPPIAEPAGVAEHVDPPALAEALSFYKARSVAARFPRATIIGADTIVVLGRQIYGKPADAAHARQILGTLMHNPHAVITGVTLLDTVGGRRHITHALTGVVMRPMPAEAFEAYLAGGMWAGKAGAYGLQDHDDDFVERIEGSFSNVVGLPMELLGELLGEWGHHPRPQA